MDSTLKQRAILAAQIKKRNEDETDRQRHGAFVHFARCQMWTAVMDLGVDGPPSNLSAHDYGQNVTLSYTEDGITFSTDWRYCKYSTITPLFDNDVAPSHAGSMLGENPLTKTLISVPCATCGEMTGVTFIDLLNADAFVQLGQAIEPEQFCSGECEMKANGHEQFIASAAD